MAEWRYFKLFSLHNNRTAKKECHLKGLMPINEGLSRRKPYVTFHFVIFKIPSFARVIGFSFIPNIRKIDNKVKERKGGKTKMKETFW